MRDAVALANFAQDADTIVFGGAAVGGTIETFEFTNLRASTLAVPQPAGPSALLITSSITIQGTGETISRFDTDAARLFK